MVQAVRVCPLAALAAGEMRRVDRPAGAPIAVYNVGGTVYATDDTCTHGQASLTDEGVLEGHVIECGWHLGSFDVRDGSALGAPCHLPLRCHAVDIRDGHIVVLPADAGS